MRPALVRRVAAAQIGVRIRHAATLTASGPGGPGLTARVTICKINLTVGRVVAPRWLPRLLKRIQELATARKVQFTLKARRELAALELGLDPDDACELLADLSVEDWVERLASASTGEWLYVFKPSLAGTVLHVKLIVRLDCIVISFHEDEGAAHDQEDT